MSSNIRIIRVCENCSSEFQAKTTVTRFCGDTCAKKAYKKRQRVQKIETSEIQTGVVKSAPIEVAKAKSYLDIKTACLLMGISRTTLWRLAKDNKIKVSKIGKRSIITKKAIDNFFDSL
jgi:excisionase family DNA binding protein